MSPTQQVYVGKGQVPPSASPGKVGAPAIPPGHVQLYCADPPRNLVLPLGPEPVKLGGGAAGWEVVGRPHQIGMTVWSGGEPYTLQLSLMLDDYARGTEVERSMRALHRLAHGDEESEPGVLEVGGVPLPADEWVIDSLDYGDPIRARRRHGAAAPAADADPAPVRTARVHIAAPPGAGQTQAQDPHRQGEKGRHPGQDRAAAQAQIMETAAGAESRGVKRANQKAKLHRKGDKFQVGAKIRAPMARTERAAAGRQGGGGGNAD